MTQPSAAHRHDGLSLVESSGLVVSEPVLHTGFPRGPEALPRRGEGALLAAWERLRVDPADAERRRHFVNTLFHDLLAWPRGSFRSGNAVPETALVRPDDLEETPRPSGILEDSAGRLLPVAARQPPHPPGWPGTGSPGSKHGSSASGRPARKGRGWKRRAW